MVIHPTLRTFCCASWPNLRPFNTKELQFRSKRCVFLGYSNLHKGFKCLDPSEGRVYISRDVTFDETIFPFTSLHPNAGARLRSEISLLPESLLGSSSSSGDVNVHDHSVCSLPANACSSCAPVLLPAGTNATENGVDSGENGGDFMYPP